MNRKQYQKDKNRFDYLNKKLYRAAQSILSEMPIEERQYWIDKAKSMDEFYSAKSFGKEFKYKPHVVYAEESKWVIHRNWAYIPSWCTYKKNHPSEELTRKQMVKIIKGNLKCQRESSTVNRCMKG